MTHSTNSERKNETTHLTESGKCTHLEYSQKTCSANQSLHIRCFCYCVFGFSIECCLSYILYLVAIVTTRKTEHRETVGRKPSSLKTRRRPSQRRASRSHRQQKPQPLPRGNAAEEQAARLWTWALQPTTLETRAQTRRCLNSLAFPNVRHTSNRTLVMAVSLCFSF